MKYMQEVTAANALREHETARECLKVQDIPSFTINMGFMGTAEAAESVKNSVICLHLCTNVYYKNPASYDHVKNKT